MRPVALALIACRLFAATYCVSNSGSDGASGTATGPLCTGVVSPWQTISKVNAQTLNPGDIVLLQAGGTWREQLFVNFSGSAGLPITYGAYGAGARPIITGGSIVTSFTQVGSTQVWTKTVATRPNVVIFNGLPGVQQASSATVTSALTWSYSGTTLSVFSPSGDPSTLYAPLEVGQRDYAIVGNPQNFITINGLQTQYANNSGIAFFSGSNHITVSNSVSWANYYFGIEDANATGSGNATITGNTVFWNGSSGIVVSGTGNSAYIARNTAYNNAWGGNWTVDTTFNAAAGIRMYGNQLMSNNIIEYNDAYNNGLGPTGIWNTQGNGQSPPDQEDGGGVMYDTMGTGNVMRFNRAWNNEVAGLRVVFDVGTLVYGNSSWGNVQVIELAGYSGMGIDLDFGINGTQVFNNTFQGNQINILAQGDNSQAKTVLNLAVTNNLSTGGIQYDLDATVGGNNDGTNGSGNTYTYNALGAQATNFIQWGAGSKYSTYSAWESAAGNCGSPGCSHSLQSAVTYANTTAGDLRLPRSAAALTAGSTGGVIGSSGAVTPALLTGAVALSGNSKIQ